MLDNTVYIESVAEFLNALPTYEEFSDTLIDNLTLYRGQSNRNWNLMPGVLRNREDYLNEELYIKECLHLYPEEFEDMSKLDMLIKMQHYGIPTRLLDLTSNPLIALYFACSGQNDEDGVVYITQGAILRSTDLAVNLLVEYIFSFKSHNHVWDDNLEEAIREKLGTDEFKHTSDDFVKYIITSDSPILFAAKLANPRIKSQKGYFAIYRGLDNWREIQYSHKIYIKKDHKEAIIGELERIGINSGYVFPELTNGAEYITSSVRRRNLQFNKRFYTPFDKINVTK